MTFKYDDFLAKEESRHCMQFDVSPTWEEMQADLDNQEAYEMLCIMWKEAPEEDNEEALKSLSRLWGNLDFYNPDIVYRIALDFAENNLAL